ncbi:cysteine sulfinic acid decarboxylase [Onthophagus taurus]|uniref:cysteine sulfinic acid decarboxylase n=1 Tax=Onthophagus taurus TaxID=166361 RepID=UPI000C20ACC1|nr:cysteine sulfinic acid decarboxylase [Onthophagus taurus]
MPSDNLLITSEDPVSSGVSSEDDDVGHQKELSLKKDVLSNFESLPDKNKHETFLKDCVDLLLKEAVFHGTDRENKVLDWKSPEELLEIFDFNLNGSPSTHEELKSILKNVVKFSVKTGHPYFVNQLFSSLDPYGLIGQWLTDALNPSVYTYEVSPVFTLMEEVVLKEMRIIVGYKDGKGDGIFCPGGSMANGYAISCARYKFNPNLKETGLHNFPRLVLFTSEDAHYSVKKMASFLGIGTKNVYTIKTDDKGKINVDLLKNEIERVKSEGGVPFMVSATAGTTVLGAFDPINDLADVCEEHNLWLHVDAAWGGGALISEKYKNLMKGIHRADSITWNPHKLLTAPQQCSTLLLKHEGILSGAHSANAAYLFQKDKFYDTSYDTGDKHVQCGRRADVLKFWYMWKAKGTHGLTRHVEKVFDNAEYFTKTIKSKENFKMVLEEPECTNVCFWYVPPSLLGKENEDDYEEKLHKIAPKIKERMMKDGSMMVTYQAQKDWPNFFRIVFQNSALTHDDMMHFIQTIERLGCDL